MPLVVKNSSVGMSWTPAWTKIGGKNEYEHHYRGMLTHSHVKTFKSASGTAPLTALLHSGIRRKATTLALRCASTAVCRSPPRTPRTASRELFNIDLHTWLAQGSVHDIQRRGEREVITEARRRPKSATVNGAHRESLVRHFLDKIRLLQADNLRLTSENCELSQRLDHQRRQLSDCMDDREALLVRLEESISVCRALRAELSTAKGKSSSKDSSRHERGLDSSEVPFVVGSEGDLHPTSGGSHGIGPHL